MKTLVMVLVASLLFALSFHEELIDSKEIADKGFVCMSEPAMIKVDVKERDLRFIGGEAPKVIRGPLYKKIGSKIEWTLNNLDKFNGWSLTGYSWGKLDSNFNPYRIKFGIINMDMNLDLADENARDVHNWQYRVDQNQRRGAVFGLSFIKKF